MSSASGCAPRSGTTAAIPAPSTRCATIPALGTGDSVRHQTFGEGVVIGIDAGAVVTIRFEDGSERKLMLDYAPLEKLPA